MQRVNRVVPMVDLDDAVASLVARVVDKSPLAVRRGKHAMRAAAHMNFADSLTFMEAQIALLAGSDDAREGFAAFQQKRAPRWVGR